MADLQGLAAAIEHGDRATAVRLTQEAVDEVVSAQVILDTMTGAMDVIGTRFQREEIFVPEMLIAARAMKEATDVLEPLLAGAGIKPVATAVIGTVKGDLHDIGKNLVGMMLKGANIEIIDLGNNVDPEAIRGGSHGVRSAARGSFGTPDNHDAKHARRRFGGAGAGLTDVRVLLGGAPVTMAYARSIGADGYARDAAAAVTVARELLGLEVPSHP